MKPVVFLFLFFVATNFFISCKEDNNLFRLVPSSESGITFNNKIVENDSINPIDITNIYNGGGVGVGDFNNDGLQDLYFTGSLVSNKLYLNKGDLEFSDITKQAGVSGEGHWCRGVSVVDINNDGLMDIYVSTAMSKEAASRKNLLYVNQGNGGGGVPVFKELADEYGLDDTTHTTMAAFFDYDNDGDLDVYLAVNQILPGVNPSIFKEKIVDGSFPSTGRLYRNDMSATLKHPVYTDVSKQAGILIEGYSHGVNVSDINKDGWKDILVTNDFIANDVLYINNHDGTFTDKSSSYFKHTSANSMGQDVIDINNDGLSDIVVLDMNPEDNYRKKMMMNPGSYQTFQLNDFFKYQYQYVRNTLQLNQGPVPGKTDALQAIATGGIHTSVATPGSLTPPGQLKATLQLKSPDSLAAPVFSETGFYSGISETDWSWAPIVADFNNDGLRDLVVTNGFPKDITDHDFISYRKEASQLSTQANTLAQIPQVKLHNYAFINRGDAKFADVSADWGLGTPSFSNGGAYADLDNDGDLDLVINNINDAAHVYENKERTADTKSHYLPIQLSGDTFNRNGLGTWIELYYGSSRQAYEQTPYRGYLSTIQLNPHFGLDTIKQIDSVIVKWPNGKKQVIKKVATDQLLKADIKNAIETYNWNSEARTPSAYTDITKKLGISYTHSQTDLIDFNIQKLLPHKFSEYGPSLAAGDLNGDGLDDLVVGGNSMYPTTFLIQQKDGRFTEKQLDKPVEIYGQQFQVTGTILFDADGDGDNDLYLSHGGYEAKSNTPAYQDHFFINDGKGNFSRDSIGIPLNLLSKSCVRAADFDNDGDLDLFLAGRVDPWNYPKPVSSSIYRNDSKPGAIKFTDVTAEQAKALMNIGLVCDAIFTDFNNDGWPDLVLAGEWMPVTFLQNEKGSFKNITAQTGADSATGWWTSITGGDFDNDGDIDYAIGNLGQNSYLRTSADRPVGVYAKDFDKNGSFDAFITHHLPASQDTLEYREYPLPLRDDAISQMTVMKSRFQSYKKYAAATINTLFSPEELQAAIKLKATNFNSIYFRNDGGSRFTMMPLPYQAQLSAINAMIATDIDADGNLDLMMNTNDYGTDVSIGRYDALNGLVLKGNGKGGFTPLNYAQSGIFIAGNGKAMVSLKAASGNNLIAASQNRGKLKIFEHDQPVKTEKVTNAETQAEILFKDGRKQKIELYYGSSFLSQSARFISAGPNVQSITITDSKGRKRVVQY